MVKISRNKSFRKGCIILIILLLGIYIALSFNRIKIKEAKYPLVPLPLKMEEGSGEFVLKENSNIYVLGKDLEDTSSLYNIANNLKALLKKSTGFDFNIYKEEGRDKNGIYLRTTSEMDKLSREEYNLKVNEVGVEIVSSDVEGVFRGIQTLRQLMPKEIEGDTVFENIKWKIPNLEIYDKPRYEYRGIMIDVARHFFSVEEIKRQIELASYYKINKLHLHLSDDQGWRLEIKKWPELTEIGGKTQVGGGKGGYYTQEEFIEIIKYANERYIEVIPEFDMPGHTNAALASLDFLNKDGIKKEAYTGVEVGFSALMCRDERTYSFVEDIIREVSKLSPSKYIHIGGDEAHTISKEDYGYFMGRTSKLVEKYGKVPIAWDPADISNDISNNTVIQNWKSTASNAKSKNMKLIISKAERCYLDMKYSQETVFGSTWAGYIPIRNSYEWDPTDYGSEDLILGVEAPLWTENITNRSALDYMIYPRILSYAEIGWSDKNRRSLEEYLGRLSLQGERMKELKINYYKDEKIFKAAN